MKTDAAPEHRHQRLGREIKKCRKKNFPDHLTECVVVSCPSRVAVCQFVSNAYIGVLSVVSKVENIIAGFVFFLFRFVVFSFYLCSCRVQNDNKISRTVPKLRPAYTTSHSTRHALIAANEIIARRRKKITTKTTQTHAECLWCKYAARQPASRRDSKCCRHIYRAPIYIAYHSVGYGVRRQRRRRRL